MSKRILLALGLFTLSGIVSLAHQSTLYAQSDPTATPSYDCPANIASVLQGNIYGEVLQPTANQTQGPLLLHSEPTRESPVLSQLQPGEVFTIENWRPPLCNEGLTWWTVSNVFNISGYIAEGDNKGPYVQGIDTLVPIYDSHTPTPTPLPIVKVTGATFAPFTVGNVDVTGNVPPYQAAPDFSNVLMANLMNQDQRQVLSQNQFVVSPSDYLEFADAYQDIKLTSPALITPDSLLHSFHLVFDKVLRTSEEKHFLPLLRRMNSAMLVQAEANYQASKGTDWENAAKTTLAYIGVSTELADPTATVPAEVNDIVTQEVNSVNSAAGTGPSAVFPDLQNGEDWTQYIPRGHYTKSDDLKSYFRAMMYYGRMTFRLSDPEETKSALLLISALNAITLDGVSGIDTWNDLYEPTVFFVGKSDDLTIPQYLQVMQQVYGQATDLKTLQSKPLSNFITATKSMPAPQIVGMRVNAGDNVTAMTQGLRFMGQRFEWDEYAFGQLMFANVGDPSNPRQLPMALDIFAVMGSDRALQILDQAGATAYANYSTQMTKLRGQFGALKEGDKTDTLYNAWLYDQNTLVQPVPSGYPSFMTKPAYADRLLYAALGSFAELKHDTILYTKEANGYGGGGPPCVGVPPLLIQPSYVEPVPLFWARLAALAEMSDIGLNSRNLLDPKDNFTLLQIANLARRFENDSLLELNNQPLGALEQNDLSNYAQTLSIIVANTADESQEPGPAAVIADIATSADGSVLEIGTGDISNIYAVVPISGKLVLARGAVSSYYEFSHPASERLTDEKWQTILGQVSPTTSSTELSTPPSASPPPLPVWTKTFIRSSSTTNLFFERRIHAIQFISEVALYSNGWGDYNRDDISTYIDSWGGEIGYNWSSLYGFNPDGTKRDNYDDLVKDPVARYIISQEKPLFLVVNTVLTQQAPNEPLLMQETGSSTQGTLSLSEERQIISTDFGPVQFSQDGKTATIIANETWQGKLHPVILCPTDQVLATRGPYTITVKYVFTLGDDGKWSVADMSSTDKLPDWVFVKGQ